MRFEKSQIHINLAHELIHADRGMRGVTFNFDDEEDLKYQTGKEGKYFLFWSWSSYTYVTQEKIRKDEFAVMGLKYANTGDITENDIRKTNYKKSIEK